MARRPDPYSPTVGSPTPSRPLLTPNASSSATSSSISTRPLAGGVQRGDIGSAYGPYAVCLILLKKKLVLVISGAWRSLVLPTITFIF